MTARQHVPPSFNDIRHILNTAQVLAILPTLKLVTFDGDKTLYPDGEALQSRLLVEYLLGLLSRGIMVAVVTAAGYPDHPEKYEARLAVLLQQLRDAGVSKEILGRLFVMGGECSFLFRCESPGAALIKVEDSEFATSDMKSWSESEISKLLDVAEESLSRSTSRMGIGIDIFRKPRAVGIGRQSLGGESLTREQLDEITISAKHDITEAGIEIPYCAFNGGSDVWIDVGNKHIGVQALQQYLKCAAGETVHVGDQFLSTGNDIATRRACCTVWVSNPDETTKILGLIAKKMVVR
eukprot:Plantae.Rhodophyta-Rhodochaete_pulchella.ctg15543.p1 GENE.Plantae.Rhodophyta-Rhodochaete_pulchella.ctg15543~~Plantae.Rhodophyta-Rhodochaete_pulchella.ctg15543.p1  ORF type:complete len:295 (-),score=34.26 Plantae.Rhodophyta-Rhodochaete_pulchella.ctg15543:505-1389(-)